MEDIDKQKQILRDDLPAELRPLLNNADWQPVTIGRSGMHVFHVKDGYLKAAAQGPTTTKQLQAEMERLRWLQGQLPIPQIYYYGSSAAFEYLYLSEIPGVMACDQRFRADMPTLISLLAEALQMVHAIDTQHCPFPRFLSTRLTQIQQLIVADQVDTRKFKADHQGLTPQAWYERLLQLRPAKDDLAFIHGDFCLPNILIDPGKKCITGFIDWELGGIADRHEDLDAASWSLGYNFDPIWIPSLHKAYGIETIDPQKLAFYQHFDGLSTYLISSAPTNLLGQPATDGA